MVDKRISELDPAAVMDGTELFAIVQAGQTKQALVGDITGGSGITVGAEPSSPSVGDLWEDISGDIYEWSDTLGWDPVRMEPTLTLSTDHLTVTNPGAFGYYSVFSSASKASGKFVFTIELVSGGGGETVAFGIGNNLAAWGDGSFLGGGGNEHIGWFDDGRIYFNNILISTIQTFAAGDTVTIAVDRTASLIWFRTNAGNWNNSGAADPATGVGGIDISAMTGALSAGLSFYGNAQAILDVAPATPPSGFGYLDTTGWMGAAKPYNVSSGETFMMAGNKVIISYLGNVYVGVAAGNQQAGPFSNTGIGLNAMQSISGASQQNVAIGGSTAFFMAFGTYNTFIGTLSGAFSSGITQNTALGYATLLSATGDNNVALGFSAGVNLTSGSKNILIGESVDVASPAGDNQLVIGNYIYGTGLDGTLTTISAGKIGLGIKAPAAELDVDGIIKQKGYTIASTLPAAGVAGRRAYVTDSAAAPVFGATIAGGGAVVVPVFDNGTNWIYG